MAKFKGLASEAVGGAAMKQRRIKANLFGASYRLIGSPPAPRGSIHSAWSGRPKTTASGRKIFYQGSKAQATKVANRINAVRKRSGKKQGGGTGSRSDAARKAWVTRRGG